MEKGQEETKQERQKGQQEMQKSLDDMQRSQEETKNELKERLEKGQEETKKGQEDLKNSLEKKIDTVEAKINSAEEKKTLKVEERVGAVEKKVEEEIAIVEEKIERIKEQRMEDLEKKLRVGGNENKSKSVHVSAFSEPVLASPVPVTAFTAPVKPSTYDGKMSSEVYRIQFSIISEANGWTEGAKACQLAASLRGEGAEVLQTLHDTERMNLNSQYNALDLRFGQKYSKDY
ncbi:uncharacterized protein TNCV_2423401 [Trichonephila clavipes]|nr:uncharacterized protein TNCV_2423401 [Trichonephila clavipes]